ncbi:MULTISPECIES: hypothetical protein [Rhodococcus]|uniref:Uncharacterized protein n=1 Tax=Rhodococcus oxybenzonivorans TaxID=1990687 RepID=A0AAE4V378_9NOCA|nr:MULTISPECIES: hypothetical protein [Rhodococcus]MDV7243075.1 hypothetical protein [Rhodococcus oxybenzonivorans]MDV7267319.1 hypothetical protein [Rhodococcus oxybenzonivorans]MDV7275479.1 hypothetical protein [Rhodococcus oxybenzonivorans]MDV7334666.1 hypothetical protein [Rhodococcus oxybenzonivorans]MDV7344820.1 hypothetical protein [Rhodococcus oxybenzonivorans]
MMSACGTNAEEQAVPPPTTSQPPEILYTNVWSADPGIDLLSRNAELVRATYEAGELTSFVGLEKSYSGFADAVGGPARRGNPDKDDFSTWLEPEDTRQVAGTNFTHLTDWATTDSQVGATVCTYALFTEPAPNMTLNPLSVAFRIELERTDEEPGQAGIPDTDPAQEDPRAHRVPTWNVFDGWKITKLLYLRLLTDDVIPQGCTDWWRQQFPAFTENPSGTLAAPPGFEPPTMPVAVQYPEWIGPTDAQ